jgi:hypothetical protein
LIFTIRITGAAWQTLGRGELAATASRRTIPAVVWYLTRHPTRINGITGECDVANAIVVVIRRAISTANIQDVFVV